MHKFSHKSTLIQNSSLKNEKIFFCLQSAEKQVSRMHPKPGGCCLTQPCPLRAAELQVHICVFISHMLTLFCLPQNKLFQSQKTHPHGAWREPLLLFSWLCAHPVEINRFGHCALVNTFTYT